MECFLSFVALIAISTVVVSLGARAKTRSLRLRESYRRLAKQKGGVFTPGGWFGRDCVRFRYGATHVCMRTCSARGALRTRIEMDWPDARFRCQVAPAGTRRSSSGRILEKGP